MRQNRTNLNRLTRRALEETLRNLDPAHQNYRLEIENELRRRDETTKRHEQREAEARSRRAEKLKNMPPKQEWRPRAKFLR